MIVQIVDMRHKPTVDDLNMIKFLSDAKLPFAVALTKQDKLKKTQQTAQLELISSILSRYGSMPIFPVSSTKGTGIEEIREYISKSVEKCS